MTSIFHRGDWVTESKRLRRTGLVHQVSSGKAVITPSYVVQFGSGGPFVRLKETSLRPATVKEVAEKMGCSVKQLPSDLAARCAP